MPMFLFLFFVLFGCVWFVLEGSGGGMQVVGVFSRVIVGFMFFVFFGFWFWFCGVGWKSWEPNDHSSLGFEPINFYYTKYIYLFI